MLKPVIFESFLVSLPFMASANNDKTNIPILSVRVVYNDSSHVRRLNSSKFYLRKQHFVRIDPTEMASDYETSCRSGKSNPG